MIAAAMSVIPLQTASTGMMSSRLLSFEGNCRKYVPNKYDAASRTTSLAISPVCQQGNCTLWASPAGGGVWRTKNALDGQPNWTYLSASFEINSVGSIVLDPNDPTGNTL